MTLLYISETCVHCKCWSELECHKISSIMEFYDISEVRMRFKTGPAKILSTSEFRQLIKVVSASNHGLRNATILTLSHYLGLRASELAALKIEDVVDKNLKVKSELSLLAAYTKGNVHRDISLQHTKVKNSLEEWIKFRKDDDNIFSLKYPLFASQKGTAFSANSMVRMINNLYQNSGFQGCSSHTGRRTMITNLATKGIDINSIRVIAGHKSISTTQRYIDHNPNKIAEIMKSL